MNEALIKWALRRAYDDLIRQDSTITALRTLLHVDYNNEQERQAALEDYAASLTLYIKEIKELIRAILKE